MNITETIHQRRSIGRVKADPVDRALLEQILAAAVQAPNHYRTEPWRFCVMTNEGRGRLGKAYADIAAEKKRGDGEPPLSSEDLAKHEAKAFRAPVVIAVAASPSDKKNVHHIEELAAVHAAVQNMLLTAHSLGLGAIWRSGDPTYHPIMKDAFDLQEHESLVGFVYIGYPDLEPKLIPRTPFTEKTVWIDS